MIELKNVTKYYKTKNGITQILINQSLSLGSISSVALTGPSGCGKSTILRMMAGLEAPTSGSIEFKSQNLYILSDNKRSELRRHNMGFIFQSFRLFPSLTAFENIQLACELCNMKNSASIAKHWLTVVGLEKQSHQTPNTLSGGEQQRVAIARALAPNPSIIFADEPTGNLDTHNSQRIQALLLTCIKKTHAKLMLVTHDHALADMCQTHIKLVNHALIQHE